MRQSNDPKKITACLWNCLLVLGYSRLSSSRENEAIFLIQDPAGNVIDKIVTIYYKDSENFVFQINTRTGKENAVYVSPRTYKLASMFRCFHDLTNELNNENLTQIFVEQNRMFSGVAH